MYTKKVLILSETDGRFSSPSRKLCGMVKLLCDGVKTEVSVFVTNFNVQSMAEWWLVALFDGRRYAERLPFLNGYEFTVDESAVDNVTCLLVAREQKCFVVAEASVGNARVGDLRFNVEKVIDGKGTEQADEQTGDYEKFVLTTDNYYDEGTISVEKLKRDHDEKYKSVEDYSNAFEKYYATGRGDNYYDSVKKEITRLFVQFPPYYPLINKYKDSFFVRIDFPQSEKYFILGILQYDGKPKYICYGLPGEKGDFCDKDFSYLEDGEGFWMLYQDAETGQITSL